MGRSWTKDTQRMEYYERLVENNGECCGHRVPKGRVPVLVGMDEAMERFLLDVRLLKDPCIALLLEIAAQEFGYPQKGVLRIPCNADHFRRMVGVISRTRLHIKI